MPITENNIVPECYVDTKVAEILGRAARKYNHQHGSGNVAKVLKDSGGQIFLGIVDEDAKKGPPPLYFSEFVTRITENDLILKRHRVHQQYLILVCPDMEQWLMRDAQVAGIDPTGAEYGLPTGLRGFTQISKTKDIDRNIGFYRFVKALLRAQAPSVTTLQSWIELFKAEKLDT